MSRLSGVTCEDFCQELTGAQNTSFTRTYNGNPPSRIIARSKNLTLMADLSPLCPGHLLLVSNYHYYSFAEVCRDQMDEVNEVVNQVWPLYLSTFGEPVVLEHGSTANIEGSACISHAHWHFIPISANHILAAMGADGLGYADLDSLSDLAELADRQVPYFYVANKEYRRVYGIDRRMRQQYLRSVVGAIIGIHDPLWDWALVIRKEHLRASMIATAHWRLSSK